MAKRKFTKEELARKRANKKLYREQLIARDREARRKIKQMRGELARVKKEKSKALQALKNLRIMQTDALTNSQRSRRSEYDLKKYISRYQFFAPKIDRASKDLFALTLTAYELQDQIDKDVKQIKVGKVFRTMQWGKY